MCPTLFDWLGRKARLGLVALIATGSVGASLSCKPKQQDELERARATQAEFEAATTTHIARLSHSQSEVRKRGYDGLKGLTSSQLEPHREPLTALLKAENPESRLFAALLLSELWLSRVEAAIPVLIEGLGQTEYRLQTIEALERFGKAAEASVPKFQEVFPGADYPVQRAIANCVVQLDLKRGMPLVLQVLEDKRYGRELKDMYLALEALKTAGPNHPDAGRLALPLTDTLLAHDMNGVLVLSALSVLGERARPAAPVLELLRLGWGVPGPDHDRQKAWTSFIWSTREEAVRHYKGLGIEVPADSKDQDPWLSFQELLEATIKTVGTPDAASLRAALTDRRPHVQMGAALLLAKHADPEQSKHAVPSLITAIVKSTHTPLRREAAIALGRQKNEAKSAVQVLSSLLNDQDVSLREAAHEALKQIQGE